MNALAHCVEAAWSPRRTPEAEAIALAGVARDRSRAARGRRGPRGPRRARRRCSRAPCLAGRCLHNAAMGVHHGLAQLLGGRTGLPHGLANAVLLAHSMRFNEPAVPDAVARIGAALGDPADAAGAVDRSAGVARPARAALGARRRRGGPRGRRPPVPGAPHVAGNPRPVSEADALAILRAAW